MENETKTARSRWLSAVCALLLSVALVLMCAAPAYADTKAKSKASNSSQQETEQVGEIAKDLSDGVYYGSGEGYQSTITVAVTVASGKITDVRIVSHADDAPYVARAEKLIPNIISQQSADVDTISGVTFSSRGILSAVKDAMSGSGSVAITSSVWFGAAMIAVAVVLFGLAVWLARKMLAATSRAQKAKLTRRQRWCIQGMFFLLAPSSFATGFMGLKTLLMQINVMNTHRGYDFEVMSFTVFLVLLLVLTVVLGRFFCGYVCSFGLLGDAVYAAGNALAKKLGIKRKSLPAKVELALRGIKYVVLVAICIAVLMGFYTTVNNNSPWTVFGKLANLSVSGVTAVGAVLLGLVVVGMLLKERFFCEFLCPLGALFSVIPTLPTGRMRRQRPKCRKNCAACKHACPVSIEPKGRLLAGECIMCNSCADVCPQKNVTCGLELRADQLEELVAAAEANAAPAPSAAAKAAEGATPAAPGPTEATAKPEGAAAPQTTPHKRSPRELLFCRPVSVLWKAALVLLVLWLMQITRFLPMLG